mmetsp:Transcript_13567/g.16446  ORF Transcript_13567/g.16446 Transcript_13567/m.16446 type:complete len:573 (+) Transcript_13567:238-1956(+)
MSSNYDYLKQPQDVEMSSPRNISPRFLSPTTFISTSCNYDGTNAAFTYCPRDESFNRDTQQQAPISITDLDKMQRQRREEKQRCNWEFTEARVSESIKRTGTGISNMNMQVTERRLGPAGAFRRRGHQGSRRPPCLKLRPHTDFELRPDERVIINNRAPDDNHVLGSLFLSPHSDRFVLSFPENPSQGLALPDDHDDEDHDDENDVNLESKEQFELDLVTYGASVELPKDFKENLRDLSPVRHAYTSCDNSVDVATAKQHFHPPSSTCSENLSLPAERGTYFKLKKKILLKPKPRESCNATLSPTGSSSSLSTSNGYCVDEKHKLSPKKMEESFSSSFNNCRFSNDLFDDVSNKEFDVNIHGMDLHGPMSPDPTSGGFPRLEVSEKTISARPLKLKQKKTMFHRLSNSILSKTPSTDKSRLKQNNDVVKDLKVPPPRPRRNSDAFTPSPTRKHSLSFQDQIEMAKEAAVRFGSSRKNSMNESIIISPSQMSESNFRTPVTAPRNGSFHQMHHLDSDNGYSNGNHDFNDIESRGSVGLFLPGLFASFSEDELSGSCTPSSSFLDLVKGAFSPL